MESIGTIPVIQKRINKAFWMLEKWISSWQKENGGYNGIIATFWDYSEDWIKNHTMNQYPIILGYLALYDKFRKKEFLDKAKRAADFLVSNQDKDGSYIDAWGDIPGKESGPVLNVCPDTALLEVYLRCGDEKYLKAAKKNIENYIFGRWWDGKGFSNYVANQTCKIIEALLILSKIEKNEKYYNIAVDAGRWVLSQQIKRGDLKGAIYQAKHDDRLFLVYNGKCLPALVKLFEYTNDKRFLDAAKDLSNFILKFMNAEGAFYSYLKPKGEKILGMPSLYTMMTILYRISRKFSLFNRSNLPSNLKRMFIKDWSLVKHPIWIARSACIILGLLELSKYVSSLREKIYIALNYLLSYQYPNGGFPNAIGYLGGDTNKSWQDVVCPIRWNGYVFPLLSELVTEPLTNLQKKQLPILIKEYYENSEKKCFVETEKYVLFVSLANPKIERFFIKTIDYRIHGKKQTGCTFISSLGGKGKIQGNKIIYIGVEMIFYNNKIVINQKKNINLTLNEKLKYKTEIQNKQFIITSKDFDIINNCALVRIDKNSWTTDIRNFELSFKVKK